MAVRERGKINHRYCYTSSGCQRERGEQITEIVILHVAVREKEGNKSQKLSYFMWLSERKRGTNHINCNTSCGCQRKRENKSQKLLYFMWLSERNRETNHRNCFTTCGYQRERGEQIIEIVILYVAVREKE